MNTNKREIKKSNDKLLWTTPKVKKLGNAKKIVANVNIQGSGDSVFSVLDPS